jgi:hypothetical protein
LPAQHIENGSISDVNDLVYIQALGKDMTLLMLVAKLGRLNAATYLVEQYAF